MTSTRFMDILSRQQIELQAPSIFAEHPAEHTSPDYQFVGTSRVLDMFQDNGWGVYDAKQTNVRNADKRMGTKHMFSLRRLNDAPQGLELGGLIPTIIGINSHDWSSRFELLFGMLRLVCGNGLMIQGAQFDAFSVRHDRIVEDIEAIMAKFASGANRMMELANRWAAIELSHEQAIQFATMAAKLRFGDEFAGKVESFLYQRRQADMASNLWTIFNVIQENMLQGGFKVNQRRARKVQNIAALRTLNTGLFQIAEGFAPHSLD